MQPFCERPIGHQLYSVSTGLTCRTFGGELILATLKLYFGVLTAHTIKSSIPSIKPGSIEQFVSIFTVVKLRM
jgi:hypothetical protein